jgi:hypothetical protein
MMTQSAFAAPGTPGPIALDAEYRPGVCNIGPAEIAARRRSGHVGVIAAIVLFVILVALGVPPIVRLLVGLPVAIAASGYLQAYLKFCAGFGARGVFNFGGLGTTNRVEDAVARSADRRRAYQIGLASFAIGLAVGIVAVLLPV